MKVNELIEKAWKDGFSTGLSAAMCGDGVRAWLPINRRHPEEKDAQWIAHCVVECGKRLATDAKGNLFVADPIAFAEAWNRLLKSIESVQHGNCCHESIALGSWCSKCGDRRLF